MTGFVLVPALGLGGSLGALAVVAASIGAAAFVRQAGVSSTSMMRAAALVAGVAGLAIAMPRDRLATLLATAREGELVFYEESPGGTVAVIEQASSTRKLRRLYIQGVSNTGDAIRSNRS